MNRSDRVGETLRAALNVLSSVDPTWYLKYLRRFGYPRKTLSKDAIVAAAEDIGRDGMVLLERIWHGDAPAYLRSLPAIELLRGCWIVQFWTDNGVLRS
jgi:transposase